MKLLVVILLFFTSGIYAQNNERIVNLEEWNNAVNFLREKSEWQDADSASIVVVESLIRAELLGHENPIHDSLLLLNLIREYCYSNGFSHEELYRELKLLGLYSPYLTHQESEELTRKAGEVYYIFGDYELAKEFFKKSLSYHNLKVESYLLGRIGRCFLDLKNLDSAMIYYEHALMLSKNETERIGNANSVGYTSFLNRDYKKANKYYQKALDLFSKNHESIDSIQYFIVQSNLASLKLKTGYIEEGVHKLESIAYLNSLFLKKLKEKYQINAGGASNIAALLFGDQAGDWSKQAFYWYEKSADKGDVYGISNLGRMYEDGKFVEKDALIAVKYYSRSSEQGHAWSQNRLGYMYSKGLGVEQSFSSALKLFEYENMAVSKIDFCLL